VRSPGILDGAIGAPFAVGRSGPDEFLLVGVVGPERVLEATCHALEARLAEVSLQFEGTSGCRSPSAPPSPATRSTVASMTVLLATAARHARGGEGRRWRRRCSVASRERLRRPGRRPASTSSQGLVHAVDIKDRYTNAPSADVARYGAFIAERLGLDAAFIDTIRVAGLLHDVGKIAIPDAILRKPGRLTADELAVLQQHVALGDMIVRDVPNVDLVARRHPPPPRALGRHGLPRPARGDGHPDDRADPRRRGRRSPRWTTTPAVSQGPRRA
jgi:hypothetical protein